MSKEEIIANNQFCKIENLVKIYQPHSNILLIMTDVVYSGLARAYGHLNCDNVKSIDPKGKKIVEVVLTSKGYEFNNAGQA